MIESLNDNASDLIVGAGVKFNGTITVPNKAVISGEFNGELTAKEVHVTETGVLTGITTATNIRVQGEIHNEIHCRELLSIQRTGKATGRIDYGQIEIERGGKFDGSMSERNNANANSAPAAATPTPTPAPAPSPAPTPAPAATVSPAANVSASTLSPTNPNSNGNNFGKGRPR